MFERFTDRARRVVVLAQEEARGLSHNYIGTEHILLGLIHEGEGVAAKVLRDNGLDLHILRGDVERVIGMGAEPPGGHIPFTPRAKKVLELSLREALQLNHNYIGTEHILLGLIREGEGIAAQVLAERGVRFDKIRRSVIEEARLQHEGVGSVAGVFAGGPSIVARLERLQESIDRVERRLDAINAPPDPAPGGSAGASGAPEEPGEPEEPGASR